MARHHWCVQKSSIEAYSRPQHLTRLLCLNFLEGIFPSTKLWCRKTVPREVYSFPKPKQRSSIRWRMLVELFSGGSPLGSWLGPGGLLLTTRNPGFQDFQGWKAVPLTEWPPFAINSSYTLDTGPPVSGAVLLSVFPRWESQQTAWSVRRLSAKSCTCLQSNGRSLWHRCIQWKEWLGNPPDKNQGRRGTGHHLQLPLPCAKTNSCVTIAARAVKDGSTKYP